MKKTKKLTKKQKEQMKPVIKKLHMLQHIKKFRIGQEARNFIDEEVDYCVTYLFDIINEIFDEIP